jgi:hypothetical protein
MCWSACRGLSPDCAPVRPADEREGRRERATKPEAQRPKPRGPATVSGTRSAKNQPGSCLKLHHERHAQATHTHFPSQAVKYINWALRCFQWNRSPHSWSSDGSALGSRTHNDQPSLSPGEHPFAQTGAQAIYFRALREQDPVQCSFRWNGYWACLKDHPPSGAPALALVPPTPLHPTVLWAAPEPLRSLPVVRLMRKERPTCCRFLRFSAGEFQAARPRVWQVRWNSARRVR